MSIKAMTAVFDHSETRGSTRLVLLAIADRSHSDGTGCWRGKESLARMARVSRATVTDAIRTAEELGELIVERRDGATNVYRLVLPGLDEPEEEGGRNPAGSESGGRLKSGRVGGQDLAGGRLPVQPGGGYPSSRDTSIDVHEPSNGASPSSSLFEDQGDAFDSFWAIYPRKRGKSDARRKWVALLRAHASVEELLNATRIYAASDVVARGYVMNPVKFLNGSWEDYRGGDPDRPNAPPLVVVDGGKLTDDDWNRIVNMPWTRIDCRVCGDHGAGGNVGYCAEHLAAAQEYIARRGARRA